MTTKWLRKLTDIEIDIMKNTQTSDNAFLLWHAIGKNFSKSKKVYTPFVD